MWVTVTKAAIDNTVPLPIMEELDVTPTIEELSMAIGSLPRENTPGTGGIAADILQCGNSVLLGHLHIVLYQC